MTASGWDGGKQRLLCCSGWDRHTSRIRWQLPAVLEDSSCSCLCRSTWASITEAFIVHDR